jgi:hypothetical protein
MIKKNTVVINGHSLERIDHPKHADFDFNKGFNWQTYHNSKIVVFSSLKKAKEWAKGN